MRIVNVRVLVQHDEHLNPNDPTGLSERGYLDLTETIARIGQVIDITPTEHRVPEEPVPSM